MDSATHLSDDRPKDATEDELSYDESSELSSERSSSTSTHVSCGLLSVHLPTQQTLDSIVEAIRSNDPETRFLATASLRYQLLIEASRTLQKSGLYQARRLQVSPPPPLQDLPQVNLQMPAMHCPRAKIVPAVPQPLHHLNYNGEMITRRSVTPPEVTMWLVICASRINLHHPITQQGICRKGVLTSQAVKWVDPFNYVGTNLRDHDHLYGTALVDFLRPHTCKVYEPHGTWLQEAWRLRPVFSSITAQIFNHKAFGQLPLTYKIRELEVADTIVNDDGRAHLLTTSHKSRRRADLIMSGDLRRESLLRYELKDSGRTIFWDPAIQGRNKDADKAACIVEENSGYEIGLIGSKQEVL